jgi:monoamine oxidase
MSPIIIIGAGFAGLAAAQTLLARGKKVIVLEGRTRLGGRTHTQQVLSATLDFGGAWIHGPILNPLTPLAEKYALELGFTDFANDSGTAMLAFDGQGEPYEMDAYTAGKELFDFAMTASHASLRYQAPAHASLADILASGLPGTQDLQGAEKAGFQFASTYRAELIDNADLTEIDYARNTDYNHLPGGDLILATAGGYAAIYERLAAEIRQAGGEIRLGERVEGITWGGASVQVKTNQGDYTTPQVVVTVPLGVLKANSLPFTPALPEEKQTAIREIGFGLYEKLFLQFEYVFWSEEAQLLQYHPQDDTACFQSWLNLAHYVDSPILATQHAGSRAVSLNQLSDEELVAQAMQALRAMFGAHIPDPIGFARTHWQNDPFALGSYSFQKVGMSAHARDILRAPLNQQVYFAGEACHPHWFGTVHGAWESGVWVGESIA